KPLMLLATLPRVLSPTEKLRMPVNVFAMEDKVKDVHITIQEKTGLANFVQGSEKDLYFSKVGDEVIYFPLEVSDKIGVATFVVTATGGGERASQEIEINVRNPNPDVHKIYDAKLALNEKQNINFEPFGTPGTNSVVLEISNIPPLNLKKRLDYLIRYPYGCLEQTTSSVFPQLYLHKLIDLTEKQKKKIEHNIKSSFKRLRKFQKPNGDFVYWPGGGYYSAWANSYAGHFILEAEKLGYTLPLNMKAQWVKAQSKHAKQWLPPAYEQRPHYYYDYDGEYLVQAYRLFTLALANAPEWGAMNRLLDDKNLPKAARWRLAAAYALAGKPEVAQQLINAQKPVFAQYTEMWGTYGSELRDEAMALETLSLLDDMERGNKLMLEIAESLSQDHWYSTQTIAYSLLAVAKYIGAKENNSSFEYSYRINNQSPVKATCHKTMVQIPIEVNSLSEHNISLENTNSNLLFARLILSGKPHIGDASSDAKNLDMEVRYTTTNGTKLDPSSIEQGMDFIVEVIVRNPNKEKVYREMALTQVFPAGWEIRNPRIEGDNASTNNSYTKYVDIRDDRINVFFDVYHSKPYVRRMQLNAAYTGKYYLPTIKCEAMYDNTIYAHEGGYWVEVVAREI
ncbi:MAG TPA: hypothetical protein ENJ45_02205, partial [Phaeodactylibacter sp.]|nr:hypothetical protein [Phaeodactylibacter sp.]